MPAHAVPIDVKEKGVMWLLPPYSWSVYSRLRSLGATHELAALMAGGAGHWWRHSEAGLNRILTVDYFDALGFPRLA